MKSIIKIQRFEFFKSFDILSTITHSHNGIGIYIPKRTFQKQVPISIFKVALEIE